MNKKYLLIAVVILGAGVLYKRSMEGMKRETEEVSSSSGMVTLVSNDGKNISISRAAAEQSPLFKSFLELEGQEKSINVPNFSAKFIRPIVDFLEQMLNKIPEDEKVEY